MPARKKASRKSSKKSSARGKKKSATRKSTASTKRSASKISPRLPSARVEAGRSPSAPARQAAPRPFPAESGCEATTSTTPRTTSTR